MDYKVLYRKYRPTDFKSIMGQDYIVSILKNSIKNDKISHAYIFSGPRGTGKTSTAKVFAKAINCLNPTEDGPCNECEACKNFKGNGDIIEIDAASNNGVDEIREIINNIKLAPNYSKYKVYIIDEVHMLSTSAFNALLLTLEEPPEHVVFILATTNIEAVPITILSRCQRFDFQKISDDIIIERLKYVANEEKIKIDDEAIKEIAYISEGGMRDALSILDQLSSSGAKITIDTVISHFGSISRMQIDELFECIYNKDIEKFINIITKFKTLSVDYKVLIKKILEKAGYEAIEFIKNKDYTGLPYSTLKDIVFNLASISNYATLNVDPLLLIEITLLKYFQTEDEFISQEINLEEKEENSTPKKTEMPEKNVDNSKNDGKNISQEINIQEKPLDSNPKDDKELEKLIKIRINNCFVNAKKEYLNTLKKTWNDFIAMLDDTKLLNILVDSNVVVASDKVIVLSSKLDSTSSLINNSLDTLESVYKNATGDNYKFISIPETRWKQEQAEYVKNLKNKIEYSWIDEPNTKLEANETKSVEEIENVAYTIFGKEKVEII